MRRTEYNESVFLSDLSLLQETSTATRAATRRRAPPPPCAPRRGELSRRRQAVLIREAASRGTQLRFLPGGFDRQARNRTAVIRDGADGERALVWTLEVMFGQRVVRSGTIPERTLLRQVVVSARSSLARERRTQYEGNLVAFFRNEAGVASMVSDSQSQSAADDRRKRRRVETRMSDEVDFRKFVPLDLDKSVRDCLVGRVVLEFPVVHVAVEDSEEAKKMQKECMGIFERPERRASDLDEEADEDDEDDGDDEGDEEEEGSADESGGDKDTGDAKNEASKDETVKDEASKDGEGGGGTAQSEERKKNKDGEMEDGEVVG